MLTLTVGDLQNDDTELKMIPYSLYVVREGETVFYVGKSKRSVYTRLLEHIGIGRHGSITPLGRLILDNLPTSKTWHIDLTTLEETGEQYLGWAEEILIRKLRPCLNAASNPNPSPLPEKYRSDRGAAASRAMRKAFGET